jgi:hypothetical protein
MDLEFLRRSRPNVPLDLHPGINFSNMPVGGDLGGLIFAVGSVAVVVIGLPYLGWFFAAALAGGIALAAALLVWHQTH